MSGEQALSNVERCEQVIARLTEKRSGVLARVGAIAKERAKHGFSAHVSG